MASLRSTIPFWILMSTLLLMLFTSMEAREYVVGGDKCSWGIPISSFESIQKWAETNRFIVGDILIFEYDETDAVLRVTKKDYKSCNVTKPIEKYENGRTKVELDRSGPFYFIGRTEGFCEGGQKLAVVVISDRKHPTLAMAPAPTTSYPAVPPAPTRPPDHESILW
ncbi:early nodulin-like protein 14 [Corylus avellana]|uniref:early nodulin-like protein 14 n=1 Tax=Corylus avellana TaxID=13451 RepID=UPI00286A5593|nr:early nodulin-like protein 14 [Corylus avellana]